MHDNKNRTKVNSCKNVKNAFNVPQNLVKLKLFLCQRVTQKALQLPFFLFFVNNRRNFQIAFKFFYQFAKTPPPPPPQISFITCQFFWSFCQNNILSLYNNEMYYL